MNIQLTSLQRRLAATVAVACTLAGAVSPALAQGQWGLHPHQSANNDRMMPPPRRPFGLPPQHAFAPPQRAFGLPPAPPVHNYAHVATPHGTVVPSVPPQSIVVHHAGIPYSVHNGVWYRPHGPSFVIVAAPIGAFVPLLPPFYTTVWFGGLPYYYADNVYYTWSSDQNAYEVVSPPPGAPEPVVNGDRLYAYPLEDQSPEQQARDRYECNAWATDQTGFDPSQSGDDMTATLTAYYNLALTSCLKGRGYSVK